MSGQRGRTTAEVVAHRCNQPGIVAVEARTGRVFARHTHDQYGIGLMTAGGHRSASGRGQVEAMAGDVITVNPSEVHDGTPLGGAARHWRMLYLDPPAMDRVVADVSEDQLCAIELAAPVVAGGAAPGLFRQLFRNVTAIVEPVTAMAAETALATVVAVLVADPTASRADGRRRTPPAGIARARQRIDDAPDLPLTLDNLATTAGTSRYALIRGFIAAYALPPHAYLVQRRLALARRTIVAGATLAEVAHAAGFADQSHLTRLFTRNYGMSPGAYARAVRPAVPIAGGNAD